MRAVMVGSRPRPALLPPLPLAAGIVALAAYSSLRLAQLADRFASGLAGSDFYWNVSAAGIGLRHGWAAVYDRQLYGQVTHQGGALSYANLPVIAWLTVPFAGLPFRLGLLAWMAPLVALLLLAWWLAAPGGGWQRVAHLGLLLAAAPVLRALDLGQYHLAVVGFLALHWWLARRGRPVLAGVVLALACLKPQDVFLVPLAVALSGRWRCLGAWAVAAGLLGLAMALVLGPAGLEAYRRNLDFALDPVTTATTLWGNLPAWVPALPLRAAIATTALLPALFEGAPRYGRAVAAGVVGSVLCTPYLNDPDLSILVLAGWLALGAGLPGWARWALLLAWLAIAIPAGGVPRAGDPAVLAPLAAALFWLVALAALAVVPWLAAPSRHPARAVAAT